MTSLGFDGCFSNMDDVSFMIGDFNTMDMQVLDNVTQQTKNSGSNAIPKVQTPMKATSFDPSRHMSSSSNMAMSPRQRAALMTSQLNTSLTTKKTTNKNVTHVTPPSRPAPTIQQQTLALSRPKQIDPPSHVLWNKREVDMFLGTLSSAKKPVVDNRNQLLPEVLAQLEKNIPSKSAYVLQCFHVKMFGMTKMLMRTYGLVDENVAYDSKKKLQLRLTPKDSKTSGYVTHLGLNPNLELVLKSTKSVRGLVKHLKRKFKLLENHIFRLTLLTNDFKCFACEFRTGWDTKHSKYTVGEVYQKLNCPKDFELQYTVISNTSQIQFDAHMYNAVSISSRLSSQLSSQQQQQQRVETPTAFSETILKQQRQKVSPPIMKKTLKRDRREESDIVVVKKARVFAEKKPPRRVQLQQISTNVGAIQGNSHFQGRAFMGSPLPKDVTEIVTKKAQSVFSGKSVFAAAAQSGGSSGSSSSGGSSDDDEEEEILGSGVITS